MASRTPLTAEEKAHLYWRKKQGATHRQVAAELKCATETVRKKWQAYQRNIEARARGRPAKGILSTFEEGIREKAIEIKKAHPHWGPANVQVELSEAMNIAVTDLPSAARLSVLFRQRCPEAVQPRKRRELKIHPAGNQVHQRWQLDAIEKIAFGQNQFAAILEVRDSVGALMIAGEAFETTLSPSKYRKPTLEEIRSTLRQAFSIWGRPAEIQTDHEDVYFGSPQSDFPMPFSLWLEGLGIRHVLSRVRCPTDQAQVERNHRTVGDMCWKDQHYSTLQELQQELDRCRQRYHYSLPVHASTCPGLPPLIYRPDALHSGRPYLPELEWDLFSLEAIDQRLAALNWTRKVDCNGTVLLGNNKYYLHRPAAHQNVNIRFLPEIRSFHFENQSGKFMINLPAIGLDKASLIGWVPVEPFIPIAFQLSLPFVGV